MWLLFSVSKGVYSRKTMKKLAALAVFIAVFASLGISDAPPKDSEFIFARVQFNMNFSAGYRYREAPWHHDYPYSEDLYLTMLKETTVVHSTPESYQIVRLDSPDIFKYPFLYFSEPGFMDLTTKEVNGLREYLNRGGFAMFDDFRGRDLTNLREQMKVVFPNREMTRLDVSHSVFHTFYDIESLAMDPPYGTRRAFVPGFDPRFMEGTTEFWGMSDESGRLIIIANQNNDFGEFWEWVDRGEMPFKPAALSVRFGINYLVYAMTH